MKDGDTKQNHLACALTKVGSDTSEEDNELGDDTLSGENDVEYAEFSLSVHQKLPKELPTSNGNEPSGNNNNGIMSGFDDFMDLPISPNPSTVSSKS